MKRVCLCCPSSIDVVEFQSGVAVGEKLHSTGLPAIKGVYIFFVPHHGRKRGNWKNPPSVCVCCEQDTLKNH